MMSSAYNPYTAQRSTTPPLYYRQPEGVAQSYYAVPAQREVALLTIPGFGTAPRASTSRPEDRPYPPVPNATSSAYNPYTARPAAGGGVPLPPPPTPNATADRFRPSVEHSLFGTSAGRWSYQQPQPPYPQQPQRQDEEGRRLAQLEAEEAALAAEEAALKAKKTELLVARRRQEEEQLRLSEGWATLLEREERYYTEPVPDFTQDIAAGEHQCAALHEQLQQVEGHRAYLAKQLEHHDFVVKDQAATEKEIARVREGLQGVEQRRRACIARAERFFDVETKRALEAGRAARKLDMQLKDMTSSGPLAQLQMAGSSASRSQSRAVSFAPADKSIVIDIGRNGSLSTSASMERGRTAAATAADTQGLSQEEEEEEQSSGGSLLHRRQVQGYGAKASAVAGNSVCLGLEDDEEMGIGGTSVAFSFNGSGHDAIKRRKLELTV